MATPQPEDGGEPSSSGNSGNVHFFRPNDGIYVSEGTEQRTICVSPSLPSAMARNGDWHVEQFELHKELYRGKTSLLYMATDRISGTQVALKLYRKKKLSVLNRYQVEREVRLHINLHHDNIIHLFAAFEDEKHVYMVQEFAVCGDLFEDLKKGGGQLKEKYAVRDVIVPFLSALAYLHGQGIIHRDIKPENILLGANKVIKVADFGLSININHERPVTRAGTLDYMAPEVLVCPDKRRPEENKDKVLLGYSAQVDSWAVGILAYELLVGYPPFEQESRAATYEHIMYKEPKFPSWMSEDAKKFIGLALCKNATQRPTVYDLMQHAWMQPYVMRHMLPAPAAASPGPSRLRHSVSPATDGSRDGMLSMSYTANGMASTPSMTHGSESSSAMTPAPAMTPGAVIGTGGRVFVPVAPPPAGATAGHHHTGAVGATAAATVTVTSGAVPYGGSPVTGARSGPVPPVGGAHDPSRTLKTSSSLHSQPTVKSQDPLGGLGDGGRLHDSISDPTARPFEPHSSHPPGAAAAASLHGTSTSTGGNRSGGGVADAGERGAFGHGHGPGPSASNSSTAGGGVGGGGGVSVTSGGGTVGVRPLQQLPGGGSSTSNLAARTAGGGGGGHPHPQLQSHPHPAQPAASRAVPPPLALEAVGGDMSVETSGGGPSNGDYMPLSPHANPSRGASALSSRPVSQFSSSSVGGPMSAPPRHRMAALIPPVNISAVTASGGGHGLGPGPGHRMPAPPISPKPPTPEVALSYHRPASGVLSDDTFLPPARSPSISLGSQLLSPLQAQLLAPRPGSRLNSPSHSRRNSVSQAGQAGQVGYGSAASSGPQHHQHVSTPLPLLSTDYTDIMAEDPAAMRTSTTSFRSGGGANGVAATGAGGGGGGAASGKGPYGKLVWSRDPAPPQSSNGGCSGEWCSEGPGSVSVGNSFSSRAGGGAVSGGGAAGGASSPMMRSGGAPRVRMLAPDEMRPLMRESSISSFKSSGGGSLREDLAQQSMTVYHRPGKVPGIGRAALAAREAEAAEAAAGGGGGGLTGAHHHGSTGSLNKAKSLVNRNLNGVLAEDGGTLVRMGSDAAIAARGAGALAGGGAPGAMGHSMATQRSFTTANSSFARKLANGAIATKVTEYVKGRLPHDEQMAD